MLATRYNNIQNMYGEDKKYYNMSGGVGCKRMKSMIEFIADVHDDDVELLNMTTIFTCKTILLSIAFNYKECTQYFSSF